MGLKHVSVSPPASVKSSDLKLALKQFPDHFLLDLIRKLKPNSILNKMFSSLELSTKMHISAQPEVSAVPVSFLYAKCK